MGLSSSRMTTLVLPASISDELLGLTRLDVETGAVLLARVVSTPDGDLRFLAKELILVPEDAYEYRGYGGLRITSAGFVPQLGKAEQSATVPFWVHTHPGDGSSPAPSRRDDIVDADLAPLFRLRSNAAYYGSLICAHHGEALRFTGFLQDDVETLRLDRVWSVGSRFMLWSHFTDQHRVLPALFDRNIRAFGGEIQRVLHGITVAVVGCGGTGSIVAEQLTRLGVRRQLLIDPDSLSASNLTRVYGSQPTDVGRPKVEVLAEHLRRIAPDSLVTTLQSKITVEGTARALLGADIVFGCTDDNAGRLVLSRFATFFLTPVIDCGVLLTSNAEGNIDGIHGRVTILHPGAACLVCRGRIDLARAAAEALTPEEHLVRAGEGYAPALGGIEPAVVAYTSMVGAQAVGELLERLTGYGPQPVPNEVLLRIHDREISTNVAHPRIRHYCHPDTGKLGLGLTDPLLEQSWAA